MTCEIQRLESGGMYEVIVHGASFNGSMTYSPETTACADVIEVEKTKSAESTPIMSFFNIAINPVSFPEH